MTASLPADRQAIGPPQPLWMNTSYSPGLRPAGSVAAQAQQVVSISFTGMSVPVSDRNTNCAPGVMPRHLPNTRTQPSGVARWPSSPCSHHGSGAFTSQGAEASAPCLTRHAYTPGFQAVGMTALAHWRLICRGVSGVHFSTASAALGVGSLAGPSARRAASTVPVSANPSPQSITVSSGRTGSEAQ